jgi:hypothetical protein
MNKADFAIALTMTAGLFLAGCNANPNRTSANQQTTPSQALPTDPGSGQKGPGMAASTNRINGPRASSGVKPQDGDPGLAGEGAHSQHNRLPGSGERP